MKITSHLSFEYAMRFSPPENSVLISIRDHAQDIRPNFPNWIERLDLSFDDIDHQKYVEQFGYILPTPEDAQRIAEFIRKHWDKNIFVHCEAGISRSAAVAEVLRRLGWTLKHSLPNSTQFANPLLLQLIINEFPELYISILGSDSPEQRG